MAENTSGNLSILQHQIDRFGAVTVMDAMLYDYSTQKPVLKLDTLKVSSISFDGNSKEIRGGMAADLLIQYNYGRTVELTITDALLSLDSLSQLWGSELTTASDANKAIIRVSKKATVTAEGTFPTDFTTGLCTKNSATATPVAGTDYFIFNTTQGKEITVATDVAVGDELELYGYKAVGSASGFNPVETVLKSTSFPSRLTLVGRTMVINEATGNQMLLEIEVPRFQFGSSFNLALDAEGDAATFDFSGKALANEDKEIIKIKVLAQGQNIMDHAWDI